MSWNQPKKITWPARKETHEYAIIKIHLPLNIQLRGGECQIKSKGVKNRMPSVSPIHQRMKLSRKDKGSVIHCSTSAKTALRALTLTPAMPAQNINRKNWLNDGIVISNISFQVTSHLPKITPNETPPAIIQELSNE